MLKGLGYSILFIVIFMLSSCNFVGVNKQEKDSVKLPARELVIGSWYNATKSETITFYPNETMVLENSEGLSLLGWSCGEHILQVNYNNEKIVTMVWGVYPDQLDIDWDGNEYVQEFEVYKRIPIKYY